MKSSPGTRTRLLLMAAGLVAIVLFLPVIQISCNRAFIDRNSGSRKGYRDWAFGWRTGAWYQESAIEAFMRRSHPAVFQQDWISYAGTGRNAFGEPLRREHGRPGMILRLSASALDRYCRTATETEIRDLYDVLASGDTERIRDWLDRINQMYLASVEAAMTGSNSLRIGTNAPQLAPDSRR